MTIEIKSYNIDRINSVATEFYVKYLESTEDRHKKYLPKWVLIPMIRAINT